MSENKEQRSYGEGAGEPFRFSCIHDTPDITLRRGQWLILRYSYTWGDAQRTRTYRQEVPLQIHLKDVCKMRERAIQAAWEAEQRRPDGVRGDRPVFRDMHVCVADTTEK